MSWTVKVISDDAVGGPPNSSVEYSQSHRPTYSVDAEARVVLISGDSEQPIIIANLDDTASVLIEKNSEAAS